MPLSAAAPALQARTAARHATDDPVVSTRALNLLERLIRKHPGRRTRYRSVLLGPLAESEDWRIRLRAVRLLPLFDWKPDELTLERGPRRGIPGRRRDDGDARVRRIRRRRPRARRASGISPALCFRGRADAGRLPRALARDEAAPPAPRDRLATPPRGAWPLTETHRWAGLQS